MKNVSLRWQLILIFCLLGIVPQIVISYYSIVAHTESLEENFTNRVNELVRYAADQTSASYQQMVRDLSQHASQPYLQLSFQQFPQNTRVLLLKERLELFRSTKSHFSKLSLCYINGERLVTTSNETAAMEESSFEKFHISKINDLKSVIHTELFPSTDELVFFMPVFSFRQEEKVVGYMIAYLPVSNLTVFLRNTDLELDSQKTIRTRNNETIFSLSLNEYFTGKFSQRVYSADIDSLDWIIEVRISEDELFRDVVKLKRRNAVFIGAIIICALAITFIFSNKFSLPFKTIIRGTQTFANGDLEHRIEVDSGFEAKKLADAFNEMAQQLNERQAELNQAVRLASLGVMTAGIGHEIKNPLTGIKTSAQVITRITSSQKRASERDEEDTHLAEISELTEGISGEADRLTKILNDLLKFGKPREPVQVFFDISESIQRAISVLRPEFDKAQIKTFVEVPSLQIYGDSDQILQVFINVLLNAKEAVADQGGQVTIKGSRVDRDEVLIRISDNGVGIAKEKLEHIFDPFYSLKKKGTGLGLSVVYTLLKQNNAKIKVASSVGEGTEFEIRFTVN